MTSQPESNSGQVSPEAVRRYTWVFFFATLLGGAMVFFAVAGRRYQLIEQAKAKRAAGETVQPFQTPEMEKATGSPEVDRQP
jgi:hypothetical protein